MGVPLDVLTVCDGDQPMMKLGLLLNPIYTIQTVVQPVWQPAVSCNKHSTGCQTGLYIRFDKHGLTTGWMFVYMIQPVVKPVVKRVWQPCWTNSCSFSELSNQFDNRFDNRLYRVNGALQWLIMSACLLDDIRAFDVRQHCCSARPNTFVFEESRSTWFRSQTDANSH